MAFGVQSYLRPIVISTSGPYDKGLDMKIEHFLGTSEPRNLYIFNVPHTVGGVAYFNPNDVSWRKIYGLENLNSDVAKEITIPTLFTSRIKVESPAPSTQKENAKAVATNRVKVIKNMMENKKEEIKQLTSEINEYAGNEIKVLESNLAKLEDELKQLELKHDQIVNALNTENVNYEDIIKTFTL